jgi:putative phosphoribosyl transferase
MGIGKTAREARIEAGAASLPADLTVPEGAVGTVVFAHGSGSGRRSPRNMQVAAQLNAAGLGSLLFDLLTPGEEQDRRNVFDIALLAERLAAATAWLRREDEARELPVGYFGASTGAAAALWAAADDDEIGAVVSRGGRPDLAGDRLERVSSPTLLIVGGADTQVLELNRESLDRLRAERELEVIPGATHLFPEPGSLERVSELATSWFLRWLPAT